MQKYGKLVAGIVLSVGILIAIFRSLLDPSLEHGMNFATDSLVTTATITRIHETDFCRTRRCLVKDYTYTISYRLQAESGRTGEGQVNVSKAQSEAVKEGGTINVRYFKYNPNINAAIDYTEYHKTDIPLFNAGNTLIVRVFMLLGSLVLVFFGLRDLRSPAPAPVQPTRLAHVRGPQGPHRSPATMAPGSAPRTFGARPRTAR